MSYTKKEDTMTIPSLPDDLQERLRRAGVTDEASLQRALANDPQLAADSRHSCASNVWLDSKR
jgi:hypothetical protein